MINDTGDLYRYFDATQAAEFLASGAWTVPDVNGALIPLFGRALFETPAVLPETVK